MKKHDLILVEDHDFTRQTLSYELKKQENINFLAALENGKEAYEFVKKQTPDIVLMDIEMPVMDGIEASKKIKEFNPNITIIILTSHNEKELVLNAFQSGANGYCIKKITMDKLLKIIEIVQAGGIWIDEHIASFIFEILKKIEVEKINNNEDEASLDDFNITKRERNILQLMSQGLTNTQIAQEVVISPNTVKNHVASIINKLKVKDRAQAVIFASKYKLLEK